MYIREAHPDSIIALPAENGMQRLEVVPQTSTLADRLRNLRKFLSLTRITIPSVIDDDTNSAKRAYAAWPDRLYVVGADGKIDYKGRPGPFGFRVPELEAWLRENAK